METKTKCPYAVQREVNRFQWGTDNELKVVAFRLNIENGVNGDIVARVLYGELEGLFVHYKLTTDPHDKNIVISEADDTENAGNRTNTAKFSYSEIPNNSHLFRDPTKMPLGPRAPYW